MGRHTHAAKQEARVIDFIGMGAGEHNLGPLEEQYTL